MQLDLELYREQVTISGRPAVALSVIDVAPDLPAQTFVLLHGFGGNARQWQHQIEEFSQHNRVLALDLRGHGRSSRPSAGYTMPHLLADLEAVLEVRRVTGPIVLVGHSFGGAIATEFTVRYPQRVSRLILVASAGEYDLAPLYKLAFRLPDPLLQTLQPLIKGWVNASIPALKQFFHQALNPWRGWDLFPQLAVPTLVIFGHRDRVFPQAAFARVAGLIPNAEVVNVGVSAHMVMLERREAVNRAIERFVEPESAAETFSRWRSDGRDRGKGSLLARRPWLAHYEAGVPPTIDVPRLPIPRLLDRAWRRFPRRPAIHFLGRTLTYRTLSAQAGRFANALQALGVAKGARVMLLLPNVPHLPIAYYGALRLGAIVVLANPLAEAEEVVRQAQHSGAELLVTLGRFQPTAAAVQARSQVRHVVYASVADYLPPLKTLLYPLRRERGLPRPRPGPHSHLWRPLLRRHRPQPPQVEISPQDTAVVVFTGGTTAAPKGVTLSHRNLVANVMQVRAWLPGARDGEEVILSVVPFSHVYGMTAAMNLGVALGASLIMLPTFNAAQVLQHVRRYRPTFFPGVPAMYVALSNFPGVRQFNVRSIRACISGAAPLPVEVKEAFEKLTKGRLVEGYGLSEASPVTHANPIMGENRAGAIGLPLPNTEARVVDLKTGRPVRPGRIGELHVRGPQVMQGYWQDAAATAELLTPDGWLRTNDVARMDEDGYFQIISRRQDMWTAEDDAAPAFPRDVEEVIYELPEVSEAVVIAIANQPIAFVSLKAGASLPARTIIAFCKRRLPPGQVPRLVIFVKDFPRSFIGKVLRRELLRQYERDIVRDVPAEAGSVGEHLAGLEDD